MRLPPLELSCLSFFNSCPLFSTACSLFAKIPGGWGRLCANSAFGACPDPVGAAQRLVIASRFGLLSFHPLTNPSAPKRAAVDFQLPSFQRATNPSSSNAFVFSSLRNTRGARLPLSILQSLGRSAGALSFRSFSVRSNLSLAVLKNATYNLPPYPPGANHGRRQEEQIAESREQDHLRQQSQRQTGRQARRPSEERRCGGSEDGRCCSATRGRSADCRSQEGGRGFPSPAAIFYTRQPEPIRHKRA